MAVELRLPQLSEEMEEGTVSRWLKQVGDKVVKGEPLVEVETEKVIVEVEATADGVLLQIVAAEQEVVQVDGLLCLIGKPGERVAERTTAPPKTAQPSRQPQDAASASNVVPLVQSSQSRTAAAAQANPSSQAVVTPLARRVARELNIDLRAVKGSGIGGKIIMSDLQPFMGAGEPQAERLAVPQASAASAPPPASPAAGEFEAVAQTSLRSAVARHMSASKSAIPHFYMTTEIDMTECLAMRGRLNGKMDEGRITVNAVLLKAVAMALGKVPELNAAYVDGAVRRYRAAHIAFAVAIPEGLVTPVVRDCQLKSIGVIAREAGELIDRAKARSLAAGELQGGTFTISNLGMYDVTEFAAIINPPQVGILAVARPVERAVVKNGWVVIRSQLSATLSADHRALDGVTGAAFLEALKKVLEDPERLLL
ncbi:MAG: dihydrolipoamide acetyltransferase family protein [SAR324 cluster bacterium]|nr:dihydrolipoamide acetyltransferase family protein [SAR324 cluster bacterium]